MPHASYPGCEIVHVHSNVCTADILQIHTSPLSGYSTCHIVSLPFPVSCMLCCMPTYI